jgi:hypothetical protein
LRLNFQLNPTSDPERLGLLEPSVPDEPGIKRRQSIPSMQPAWIGIHAGKIPFDPTPATKSEMRGTGGLDADQALSSGDAFPTGAATTAADAFNASKTGRITGF